MLKHAACAAASSSSGLEPPACSKREPKEYDPPSPLSPPLYVPRPPLSPPSHTALALRVGIVSVSVSRFACIPLAARRARAEAGSES